CSSDLGSVAGAKVFEEDAYRPTTEHQFLAKLLQRIDALLSVGKHLLQILLLLQLSLEGNVVRRGWLLIAHHFLSLGEPFLHTAKSVLESTSLQKGQVQFALAVV